MKLTTDHSFHIGHQHLRNGEPCQDFAISGTERRAYAIVSDGCSTGGMTDVGARLVALTARAAVLEPLSPPLPLALIQDRCLIQFTDLLATCVQAVVYDDLSADITVRGDGVYAWRTTDGHLTMVKIEWAENMPCYPIYSRDGFKSFIAAHGGDIYAPRVKVERWTQPPGEPAALQHTLDVELGEALRGWIEPFNNVNDLEYLAVFSDGVQQVEGRAWHETVQELLAFKTRAGRFAQRRMSRFLADVAKVGRGPQDDIACAVIHIEHEDR